LRIAIGNIKLPYNCETEELKQAAAKKAGVKPSDFVSFRIAKESVDARKKPDIFKVFSVIAEIENTAAVKKLGRILNAEGHGQGHGSRDIRLLKEEPEAPLSHGDCRLYERPVIVGSGPAGLFCAILLSEYGFRPIVVERGAPVEERYKIVNKYWKTGILDTETNVQFGEGGAGTFSDGKLTTRINDPRCERVLKEFIRFGADEKIGYKAKPHIGSDVLRTVVANIRKQIISKGGTFLFNTRMTSLLINNGRVAGIVTESISGRTEIPAGVVVLATGHSSRDTFENLYSQGIVFEQKPFSIGVRIEHPRELINLAQYGSLKAAEVLGAADYQLFCRTGGRTAYTFCMCPGGVVVAAASEKNSIVTNGMSEFARNRENSNSAFVVSVQPADFGGTHPLAGVEFQRKWERKAYDAAGSDGSAPVQLLGDFIEGRISHGFGRVIPSYTGRVKEADLNCCLPSYVTGALKEAAGQFDRKLKGFAIKDAVLTGVETRTSSPVRIPRDDNFESISLKGLYPAGEGAGYAGGIMSAAVDGLKIAEKIITKYCPVY